MFTTLLINEDDPPALREASALVERAICALAVAQAQSARLQEACEASYAALARAIHLQGEVAKHIDQLIEATESLGRAERDNGHPVEHLVASIKRIVYNGTHFPPDFALAVEADVVSWAIESYYEAA